MICPIERQNSWRARHGLFLDAFKLWASPSFFVALLRILWAIARQPGPLASRTHIETFSRRNRYWLLYGSWSSAGAHVGLGPPGRTTVRAIWCLRPETLPLVAQIDPLRSRTAGLTGGLGKVLVVSMLLHIAGGGKLHKIVTDATLAPH